MLAQFDGNVTAADVTLTTTAETVVVTSPQVPLPKQRCRVMISAWAQLTTGTNTTGVKPRIRRGTTTGGTLVNEANNELIKIAAGGTEPFFAMAMDEVADVEGVSYSLTLEQAGASANGSCLQAGITVMVI